MAEVLLVITALCTTPMACTFEFIELQPAKIELTVCRSSLVDINRSPVCKKFEISIDGTATIKPMTE